MNDLYEDLVTDGFDQVKLFGVGKSQHMSSLSSWTNGNNVSVCVDSSPYPIWSEWGASQRDLYVLDHESNVVLHENVTNGLPSNLSSLIMNLYCPDGTIFKDNYLGANNICVPNNFSTTVQSNQQAFYFFDDVTINGDVLTADDWVGAFNGDVCVGSRKWDTSLCVGGICDIPTMGNDGVESTEGYMQYGDLPIFKIYNSSENKYYVAEASGTVIVVGATNECADEVAPSCMEWYPNKQYRIDELKGISGCIDEPACNYNENATDDDDTCLYNDCNGECGGSAIEDECGVCQGAGAIYDCGCDAFASGACDCAGNVEDCAGVCGGSAVEDCAGVCGGSAVEDCAGVCGGSAVEDCNNVCGGTALLDNCGVCDSDDSNDNTTCSQDCTGYCDSGICIGGSNDDGLCTGDFDCPGVWGGSLEYDCHNECGGTAVVDECGVCGGNGFNQDNYHCGDISVLQDIIDMNVSLSGEPLSIGTQTWTDGRLTILHINNISLTTLPESIGSLTSLSTLFLEGNQLTTLPASICDIPECIILVYNNQLCEEYYYDCIDVWGNQECLSISDNLIPTTYNLSSLYPNPFNPIVTISFSIPEFKLTTIQVYDINGRELNTLTSEILNVGSYSINWNASNYPSGVYFVKMESGEFKQTQKVVLVK